MQIHSDEIDTLVGVLEPMFIDSPTFAAVLAGPDHIYKMTNPANNHLVGHGDLKGRSVREAVPEADAQGVVDILDEVLASGLPHHWHHRSVAFGGAPGEIPSEHFVDCVYRPILNGAGDTVGVFIHGVDITDSVRAKYALETLHELSSATLELGAWKKSQAQFMTLLDRQISELDRDFQVGLDRIRKVTALEQVGLAVDAFQHEIVRLQAAIRSRIDLLR